MRLNGSYPSCTSCALFDRYSLWRSHLSECIVLQPCLREHTVEVDLPLHFPVAVNTLLKLGQWSSVSNACIRSWELSHSSLMNISPMQVSTTSQSLDGARQVDRRHMISSSSPHIPCEGFILEKIETGLLHSLEIIEQCFPTHPMEQIWSSPRSL